MFVLGAIIQIDGYNHEIIGIYTNLKSRETIYVLQCGISRYNYSESQLQEFINS